MDKEVIQEKRKAFKKDIDSIVINKVRINGLNGKKELFARKAIIKNSDFIPT